MSLTLSATAALGRLLPEMLALEELTLDGFHGSVLQAVFGGFNKTLPLRRLSFGTFSVRGCLPPLTKSLCFLPNLKVLDLGGYNGEINEHNLCGLLGSLSFIPYLKTGTKSKGENTESNTAAQQK